MIETKTFLWALLAVTVTTALGILAAESMGVAYRAGEGRATCTLLGLFLAIFLVVRYAPGFFRAIAASRLYLWIKDIARANAELGSGEYSVTADKFLATLLAFIVLLTISLTVVLVLVLSPPG